MLFVTIGPVETAAIFASLTASVHRDERRGLASRSVLIAGTVLLVFAVAGGVVLAALHVSLAAFRVAGGLLLFLQAMTLSFARTGLSSLTDRERLDAEAPGDIAVFPLAFPLIAGPGSLSAVVLLMGRAGSLRETASVIAMLIICLALTYSALLVSEPMTRWLGRTGTDVVSRVSGVLLAALAVQFVFDGFMDAGLASPPVGSVHAAMANTH